MTPEQAIILLSDVSIIKTILGFCLMVLISGVMLQTWKM
jgi:hypothetical protein